MKSDKSAECHQTLSFQVGSGNEFTQYYLSITIVLSYTEKYHDFVAVCIVMSMQHE